MLCKHIFYERLFVCQLFKQAYRIIGDLAGLRKRIALAGYHITTFKGTTRKIFGKCGGVRAAFAAARTKRRRSQDKLRRTITAYPAF